METQIHNWPLFLLYLLTVGVFVAVLMVGVRHLIRRPTMAAYGWHEVKLENGRYNDLPRDGDFVQIKLADGKTAWCNFHQSDDESWGFGGRFGVKCTRSRLNPRPDVVAWKFA